MMGDMASNREWFESVAEAQRRSKRRLPKSVYAALIAGSERGVTMNDNVAAFDELGFRPHIADLPAERSQATTVMGMDLALPVIISPTGVQAVHPDGEIAVARAAADAGTAIGLSSFASKSVEEVAAVNDKTMFQLYWLGSRDDMLARMERGRRAGAKGMILTLDWTFAHSRDWGSPEIPDEIDFATMAKFAPQVLVKPAWLWEYLRRKELPGLTVPNVTSHPSGTPPTFFTAYGEWMQTPPPTWADVSWLREQWAGPFLLKGVSHPDDARRAVDAGCTALSVSNHGGNDLDGTPASIRSLPLVVEAVGGDIEVLLDGGIRRGSDVVKALALGAQAVLLGRAYLWGLAANGQAGVANVLELMRQGIDSGLLGLGRASVHDLVPSDVIVPPGFTRSGETGPLA